MYKIDEGPNNRGIELRSHDLQVLLYLYEHKFLKTYHMKAYVNMFRVYSDDGFYRRVIKYRENKLIKQLDSDKVSLQKGYKSYRITKKGMRCLEESGYIDSIPTRYSTRLGKHIDHHFFTQDITLKFLLAGKEHQVPVKSESAFQQKNQMDNAVVADRIIRSGDKIFNIEIDTGTENHPKLLDKLDRYATFANEHKDKHHIVFFVLTDQSYDAETNYPKNRSKRIRNMKHSFSSEKYLKHNNLDIYVLSYKDAVNKIPRLIEGVFPLNDQNKINEIEFAVSLIKDRIKSFPYHFIEDEENELNRVLSNTDMLYKMKMKDGYGKHHAIWSFLDQGNVKSFNHVTQLLKVKEIKSNLINVIGLYDNSTELENDVLPYEVSKLQLAITDKFLAAKEVSVYKVTEGNRREQIPYA